MLFTVFRAAGAVAALLTILVLYSGQPLLKLGALSLPGCCAASLDCFVLIGKLIDANHQRFKAVVRLACAAIHHIAHLSKLGTKSVPSVVINSWTETSKSDFDNATGTCSGHLQEAA